MKIMRSMKVAPTERDAAAMPFSMVISSGIARMIRTIRVRRSRRSIFNNDRLLMPEPPPVLAKGMIQVSATITNFFLVSMIKTDNQAHHARVSMIIRPIMLSAKVWLA